MVTGGGWSGWETSEQTTGVLLLTINELLHKTLPRVHIKRHTHTDVMNCNALLPTEEIHTLKGRRNRIFVLEPNHLCANSAANMWEESLPAATWQMDCTGGFLGEWRTQLCNNQQLNYEIDYEIHCAGYSLILAKTVLLLNTSQGSEIFFYSSFLKSCQYCRWHLHLFLVFPQ